MTPMGVDPDAPARSGRAGGARIAPAELKAGTDRLIAAGEQLVQSPEWDAFRAWLLDSDAFLERAWGPMDRYHLAWLNVGRGSAPAGSSLDDEGTRRFMEDVARAKLAVLGAMRAAIDRGMADQ